VSAHAFREDYKQQCKVCNAWRFAKYMWNDYERRERGPEELCLKRPHRVDLCQACLNGAFCVERDNQ